MQILFVGSESIQGKKKDTGAPYGPFYKLHYLTAFSGVNTESRQVSGNGFIPKEVSVSADVFQQLQSCKPLTRIQVVTEADPENMSRTIIVSVKAAE